MTECIFCQVVSGAAPGTFVYRDEHLAAFMDIQPVNPGHLLIVPTRHAARLADLPESITGRLAQVAQRLAAALRVSGVRCEGINIFLADGEAAGQKVHHVHLHVFPRFVGDGFGLRFGPEYTRLPPRAALEASATEIRRALVQESRPHD